MGVHPLQRLWFPSPDVGRLWKFEKLLRKCSFLTTNGRSFNIQSDFNGLLCWRPFRHSSPEWSFKWLLGNDRPPHTNYRPVRRNDSPESNENWCSDCLHSQLHGHFHIDFQIFLSNKTNYLRGCLLHFVYSNLDLFQKFHFACDGLCMLDYGKLSTRIIILLCVTLCAFRLCDHSLSDARLLDIHVFQNNP